MSQRPPNTSRSRRYRATLGLSLLLGCGKERPVALPHPQQTKPPASHMKAPKREPVAHEAVDIPGGAFLAGSLPGESGRLPQVEPRRREVELGPFKIDRLPFPNDPAQPPRTGVTRAEAERLCTEANARLCTDLEWERACKGPGNDTYVTGGEWDGACAKNPQRCASGFDVLALGVLVREWVRGDLRFGRDKLLSLTRGSASSSQTGPRCALRRGLAPEVSAADLGFRCCHGAPNAANLPAPLEQATFEKIALPQERLKQLLSAEPRTRALAEALVYFREPDAANTVVARGPGDRQGFLFTVAPLIWRPVAGAEYLVVTARSGKDTSFVAVYYVMEKDDYKLASSFIMRDEVGPIAFAYSPSIQPRMHFSSCWGCPGESGRILYRDLDTAVIVQP